jgi:hypothetical protein
MAIPRSEVGLCISDLRVRHKFPLRAAYLCQPLPHVDGFPALGLLWADPTSYRASVVLLLVGWTYLLMD